VNAPSYERFMTKVAIHGDQPEDCWEWTAGENGVGYGRFHVDGRLVYPHRFAYELYVGPIPEGLDLDHVCRNRRCVRPSHLEPVTRRENLLRGDTIAAAHHENRDCGTPGCRNCQRFRTEDAA